MLILKPLDEARRDNDAIRAVIVGSGINQDGRTPGITMPNRVSQGSIHSFLLMGVKRVSVPGR